MRKLGAALPVLHLLTPPVRSQEVPAPVGHAFEVELTGRWLPGRQRPEFTPWRPPDMRHWLYVDSIGILPQGGRELRVSLMLPGRGWFARIAQASDGRIRVTEVVTPVAAADTFETEQTREERRPDQALPAMPAGSP